MAEKEPWRALLSGIDIDLPDEGTSAPVLEFKSEPITDHMVGVQRIITEIYVCTDLGKESYSPYVFQKTVFMGEMPKSKFAAMVAARARKLNKSE